MCVCVGEQPNKNSTEEIVFVHLVVSTLGGTNTLNRKWRYCRLRLNPFPLVLDQIKRLSVVAFKITPCNVYKTDEPPT